MGWQPVDTLPDLLRQAVQADGGILYEQPHQLAYIPRARLYNRAPALVLDWSAGDLASPPQPDSYARTYRNRVEVRRVEGSSAVAELIDDSGVTRDESIELALATDNVLPAHAWWRLHLASYQGLLWPRVELDLAARPEYLAPWLQCHIGSRVKIINAPTDVADQDIDLMIDGWTITLGWRELRVEMTCSPYGPWLAGEIDGEARVAPDVSWLGTDLGPDDPEMVLVTPGTPVVDRCRRFSARVAGRRRAGGRLADQRGDHRPDRDHRAALTLAYLASRHTGDGVATRSRCSLVNWGPHGALATRHDHHIEPD